MPTPIQRPTDLVSPKRAAKFLQVHQTTVYRYMHSGLLTAWWRAGSRCLVSQAQVESLLRPVRHGDDDTLEVVACEPVPPVRPIPPPVVVRPAPVPPPVVKPAPLMLSAAELAERLCISARTLWRMVQREDFPQPVRFNRKLVRWKTSEVEVWVAEQQSRPAA